MPRFTIWRKRFHPPKAGEAQGALEEATIVGSYPGATEEAALDAMAKDSPKGYAGFADLCKKENVKRSHFDLLEIKDGV